MSSKEVAALLHKMLFSQWRQSSVSTLLSVKYFLYTAVIELALVIIIEVIGG
jgi:hypothetical protein